MKRKNKPVPRFGELPPRGKFYLNPYSEYRFTSCPICEKLRKGRKFLHFTVRPAGWYLADEK
jgi:hypothetical protein